MREYIEVDDFKNGDEDTPLRIRCGVIHSQDTKNPIYLKPRSGSTEAIVQNLDDLSRLKYRKEIIAYGIKNPETTKKEKATTKKEGEVIFHIDFYKILS